jgi:RNA polymerase sigma-70 factor (TIGR02960 family)
MGFVDDPATEQALLDAAQLGDTAAFGRLVAPYRGELLAHCYRMLGGISDAEDALQNALLGAWQGLPNFAGRSSLRSWFYRIATNACLRLIERRPKRLLAVDHRPATSEVHDLGTVVAEPVWVEPCPEELVASALADPEARYEVRESMELAFVAALQHLPATQRAVLILREVLAFSAAEVSAQLGTTVPSVNSALQRARRTLDQRAGDRTQQETLRELGGEGRRALVEAFVAAWERADVPALLDLLVRDARFSMPPLPAWFQGRVDIGRFVRERLFVTPWRLLPISASGQLAFACYQGQSGSAGFHLSALNVLTLRDRRIAEMTGFLDPTVHARFGLSETLPDR